MAEENTIDEPEKEGFGELIKFTAAGFAGGLILGAVLDSYGFQRSGVGQWLVRTLSGEGESIFEGAYSIRQRIRKAESSMSEAYGWGKLLFIPLFLCHERPDRSERLRYVISPEKRRFMAKSCQTIYTPSGDAGKPANHSDCPCRIAWGPVAGVQSHDADIHGA